MSNTIPIYYKDILNINVCVWITQSCLTLCNPMDCNPPGSFVHEIFQTRILKWIAIPFSRGSSWPRDQTLVSCIAGRFFTIWANSEAHIKFILSIYIYYIIYPKLYIYINTLSLPFFTILWSMDYYPHFIDEEAKMNWGYKSYPSVQN